ncbi:hypothetical protein QE388_003587 [Microbacterium sp. SORGH_AS 969]|nr:hypothetical protein [Microbacterium sp. SORGH_AS_0969]
MTNLQAEPALDQPYYGAPFGAAVRRIFKKYATFTGRASRSEYWWWILANGLVVLVLNVLAAVTGGVTTGPYGEVQLAGGIGVIFVVLSVIWGLATIGPAHRGSRAPPARHQPQRLLGVHLLRAARRADHPVRLHAAGLEARGCAVRPLTFVFACPGPDCGGRGTRLFRCRGARGAGRAVGLRWVVGCRWALRWWCGVGRRAESVGDTPFPVTWGRRVGIRIRVTARGWAVRRAVGRSRGRCGGGAGRAVGRSRWGTRRSGCRGVGVSASGSAGRLGRGWFGGPSGGAGGVAVAAVGGPLGGVGGGHAVPDAVGSACRHPDPRDGSGVARRGSAAP